MSTVRVDDDGRVMLPPDTRHRLGLEPGTEVCLDALRDGLALYPRRPDARRALVEVSSFCNLDCADRVWARNKIQCP